MAEDGDESLAQIADTSEDGILIAKMRKGHHLSLTATAIKSVGKEHAKWSPVTVASYQFDPEISLNETVMSTLSESEKKSFVDSCPTKVYSYNNEMRKVEVTNARGCTYCEECTNYAKMLEKPEVVKISARQDKFIFYVESSGALEPDDIVERALNVLHSKLETVQEGVRGVN
eukprot:TRINITY_DN313_c0_g1_i3.p1 TRINITY_DN313_c0_g1~~TRINITY_DN313_c0_g1_i3.p1  ORF type:complete len:173 (+),score=45.94 TRINITY_DN313_c0_g1_i3:2595-3113(+)